jgi:hypothetical protein
VFGFLSDVKSNRSPKNIDYFLEFDTDSKTSKLYFNVLSGVVALSLLLTVPVDCLVAATTCKRLFTRYRNVHRVKKSSSGSSGPASRRDSHKPAFSGFDEDTYPGSECADIVNTTQHSPLGSANSNLSTSNDDNNGGHRSSEYMAGTTAPSHERTRTRSSSHGTSKEDSHREISVPPSNRESLNTIVSASEKSSASIFSAQQNHRLSHVSADRPHSAKIFDAEANVFVDDALMPEDRQRLLKKEYRNMLEGDDNPDKDKRKADILSALISAADSERGTVIDGDLISPDRHSNVNLEETNKDRSSENGSEDDNSPLTLYRQTSLEELMNRPSTFSCVSDILPILTLWAIVLALCVSYDNFGTLGIVLGPFAAAFLVYIIPSMIYFRMGLKADFQSQPFRYTSILPNQFYMLTIQILGCILLVGNVAVVLYSYFSDQVLISF